MKILGIDLGDRWVGSALSDGLGITCKPYKTVQIDELGTFIEKVLKSERVRTVVVGYPRTFSGGESAQTAKIVDHKQKLEQLYGDIDGQPVTWILWDERLSSKRASEVQRGASSAEAKQKSHSIAAAFILQSYLDNLAFRDGVNEQ